MDELDSGVGADRRGRIARRWSAAVRDRDPATAGSRLAAGLFAGAGVLVLLTAPFLPAELDRLPLVVAGGVAITTGAVVPLLPWSRWPATALVGLTFLAFVMFAVTGQAEPGLLKAYLPLYSLTFLFLGLTQTRRVVAVAVPVAALSLFIGTGMSRSSVVTAAIGIPVWGSLGVVLWRFRERQERSATATERFLAGALALRRAADESEAVELAASLAHDVLSADVIALVVRDQPGSARLDIVATRGHDAPLDERSVDARIESDGVVWVLRSGEPLYLVGSNAGQLVPRQLDVGVVGRSLYLPLPGEDGQLGAIAALWTGRVRTVADPIVAGRILAEEVGLTLERVRDAARLSTLADTDPLTNVANRRRFTRALDAMVPRDAVVLLDLDHFKRVNDTHGHAAGDETLRLFAECLTTIARDVDCVARYGGEEFALVLADAGIDGAGAVLDRLRQRWNGGP